MDYDDIHQHLVSPKTLLLIEKDGNVVGMLSYNESLISGKKALIVEGVAIRHDFQARGIFSEATNIVLDDSRIVGLRTQNPFMYLALRNYCGKAYPNIHKTPRTVKLSLDELASIMNCTIDDLGVARKFYGKCMYGQKQHHPEISPLFENVFKMDIDKGDAVLAAGLK
ncbi:MAG: hypothetical protein V1906_03605 [Candidatus Woesearchaeota archaeon]